ncbi:MAG: molybdate transport system substrate-binding protein [Campylobacterota bacterium]|nr:molybdate transport system substrate-binding protein [Campylobacterota bacterium]
MKPFKLFFLLTLLGSGLWAKSITIAAASDMKYAMNEIVNLYVQRHNDVKINPVYGSSGKTFTQISNGAPYDIYYSADIEYPKKLKAMGKAIGDVKPYAIGQIVLWSNTLSTARGIETLLSPNVKRVAIANPDHAPYGRAAVAALKYYGIYDDVKEKLIYGENISQAAQYVQTKAADIGILALSITSSPALKNTPPTLIPKLSHPPLLQGYIQVTNNPDATEFLLFFETKEANSILKKYGFILQ